MNETYVSGEWKYWRRYYEEKQEDALDRHEKLEKIKHVDRKQRVICHETGSLSGQCNCMPFGPCSGSIHVKSMRLVKAKLACLGTKRIKIVCESKMTERCVLRTC